MKGEGLGDYPRSCHTCGQPVRITGPEPLTFEWTPAHGKRSWHTTCLTSAPARTVASPASHKDDCDPSGAGGQGALGSPAVAPLYSPPDRSRPRNGGDMTETPEPQPDPEPDDGNGDEDE